jgi:hypothetical protein
MAIKPLPDPELLRKLLRYEPETGKLFWLPRLRNNFSTQRSFSTWNARYANQEGFTASTGKGYKLGRLGKQNYFAHRVAWAIHWGEEPKELIDHINGVRSDNRIDNLRCVGVVENMRNMPLRRDNKSGCTGINWSAADNKWIAGIRVNRRTIYLGIFSSLDDAVAVRKAAEMKYGFHPNHGRP